MDDLETLSDFSEDIFSSLSAMEIFVAVVFVNFVVVGGVIASDIFSSGDSSEVVVEGFKARSIGFVERFVESEQSISAPAPTGSSAWVSAVSTVAAAAAAAAEPRRSLSARDSFV